MSIFSKETSEKIGKKIKGIQSQLDTAEAQVSSKESEIEKAVSAGSVPDKLFAEAGNLKARADAIRTVLSKMQAEYEAAKAREDRAVRLKGLDDFDKLQHGKFRVLKADFDGLIEIAENFVGKRKIFDEALAELIAIDCPDGVSINRLTDRLPAVDLGFLSNALSVRPHVDSVTHALDVAVRNQSSNLESIGACLRNKIAEARAAIIEED